LLFAPYHGPGKNCTAKKKKKKQKNKKTKTPGIKDAPKLRQFQQQLQLVSEVCLIVIALRGFIGSIHLLCAVGGY
jgi:hypothetical protein